MPIIDHLLLKTASGKPMQPVDHLRLNLDTNLSPLRQVLVVRAEDLAELGISAGCLREDVVISGCSPEQFQPGSQLSFYKGAILRLTFHCEPCSKVLQYLSGTFSLQDLVRKRGLLSSVVAEGTLTVGDEVAVEAGKYRAFSDEPYERFLVLVTLIPVGQVLTYRQIIQWIGVGQSYFRVLPRYIQKAQQELGDIAYPVHRIVDSQGYLLHFLHDQRDLLSQEGVQKISSVGLVSLVTYNWQTPNIYLP
jgi:alkylated DNA nucleotide flippase Atl1